MGDWDPFAVDDAAPGSAPAAAGGTTFSMEDTMEVPDSATRVVRRDFEKCLEMTWGNLQKEEPWVKMPDPMPDLSWHKPTCTFEAWKHSDLKCELSDGIVYLTFNRPSDSNRLTGGLVAALADAIFLLHERKDLRVAVFSGEGKIFCAGGEPSGDGGGGFDAPQPSEVEESRKRLLDMAVKAGAFPNGEASKGRLLMTRLWHAWATVPQFTICICNGSAMGDGLGCVTVCDYSISLSGAFFSLTDVRAGIVPAGIAPYIVNKTGTGVAKRVFCTSENMSAEKACEASIIDEVVGSLDEANKLVSQMCSQVSKCGPHSVAFAKELVLGVAGQQIIEPLMFYTGLMLHKSSNSDEARQASSVPEGQPTPWEKTPIKPLR